MVSYQKQVWGFRVHSGEGSGVGAGATLPSVCGLSEILADLSQGGKLAHPRGSCCECHLASVVTYGGTAVEGCQSHLLNRVQMVQEAASEMLSLWEKWLTLPISVVPKSLKHKQSFLLA